MSLRHLGTRTTVPTTLSRQSSEEVGDDMRDRSSFFVLGLLVGVLCSAGLLAVLTRTQQGDAPGPGVVLKLAHSMNERHPVHLAMTKMAESVRTRSGGAVIIEIFSDGQLGSEVECIEQVRQGALSMTKCSASVLEGFVPEFAVFSVPFVFRDKEHAKVVYDSDLGRELLAAGCEVGLRGLCYYDAGARSFYTVNKPILTPDDLANLKIRVQESKTSMQMVEAFGGSPTPMNYGELYTGLQQRIVDGAENNPPSFYLNRHFEVCKHYSLNEHTRVPDVLLISEAVWDGLSEGGQALLSDAAIESAVLQESLWEQETAKALEAVQEAGVTVHRPDRELFAKRVRPLHQGYEGSLIGDLIDRILESR